MLFRSEPHGDDRVLAYVFRDLNVQKRAQFIEREPVHRDVRHQRVIDETACLHDHGFRQVGVLVHVDFEDVAFPDAVLLAEREPGPQQDEKSENTGGMSERLNGT